MEHVRQGTCCQPPRHGLLRILISIPVTVVAGIFALLLLVALFRSVRRCCIRKPSRPTLNNLRGERLNSRDLVLTTPLVANAPPPGMSTTYGSPPSFPAALQPGSGASHARAPSTVHSAGSSVAAHNRSRSGPYPQQPSYPSSGPRRQFPTHPIRDPGRNNWVDETIYNGPPR